MVPRLPDRIPNSGDLIKDCSAVQKQKKNKRCEFKEKKIAAMHAVRVIISLTRSAIAQLANWWHKEKTLTTV